MKDFGYISSDIQIETDPSMSWKYYRNVAFVIGGKMSNQLVTGKNLVDLQNDYESAISKARGLHDEYLACVSDIEVQNGI